MSPRDPAGSRGGRHRLRTGTAHILGADDPEKRRQILSQDSRWRSLCLSASNAMSTNPLTIRIDLDRDSRSTIPDTKPPDG
jgi:hypothetical protein